MRIFCSTLALLFCASFTHAQHPEFGDISIQDLQQTEDAVFPNASAILLYENIDLDFGRVLNVHERVKVYTSEGLEYTNWEIPYEDVKGLQAATYNLVNGVIQKTEVSDDNIFVEELSEDEEIRKITFPNVRPGSIIEIKYKVPFIGLYTIYTQHYLPIKKIRVNINNPVRASLDIQENPFVKLPIRKVETDYNYLFVGEDIPPLRKEKYVSNINNHRGMLLINVYGKLLQNYSWNKLAAQVSRLEWFGGQLKRGTGFFKKELEGILGQEDDELEKAKKVEAYLKSHMKWNEYYSRGSESIKKAFEAKEGSTGDINLLLVTMLREAGLDANPMLIASKGRGWVMYPRLYAYNTLVCALSIDNKIYILDASRKNLGFAQLPLAYVNGNGFIVRPDNSSLNYPVKIDYQSKNTLLISAKIDPEQLNVTGSVRKQITDYFAWLHRDRYENEREETYQEVLEQRDLFRVSNMTIRNFDKAPDPIEITYDFEYENYVEEIDKRLYIQPLLHCALDENDFNEEDRLYPIDLNYPYTNQYIINFEIPEGYIVESLPEGKHIVIPEDIGSLRFHVSEQQNTVQISFALKFNESLISADFYSGLKEVFNEYSNISKSKIVLVKK